MIDTDTLSVLFSYANLTAIVSKRIYPIVLPQDPVYPNMVYTFDHDIINTLNGESTIKHAELQLDLRVERLPSAGYQTLVNMTTHTKAAMAQSTNPFKSSCLSVDDLILEDDIDVLRRVIRFSIWQPQ